MSQRCVGCRNRGRREHPDLPKLRYRATRHAVKRYIERCAPHLAERKGQAPVAARMEMRRRMAQAEWDYEWPDWLSKRALHGAGEGSPGHLRVDASTVFVLTRSRRTGELVVVTVLTRDGEQDD